MVSLAFHLVFHKIYEIELSEVLATKMSVMRRSIKVSSFEMQKFDPFFAPQRVGSAETRA